ncbi:MAG: dihydroneopterin aldolase [Bacteroidota bacterium]
MSKILLEEMEFFAYHGCFKEEQVIGNRFLVDLELEVDTEAAEKSDKLQDTVNYQVVYTTINQVMRQKSHLLEHVARRILDALREGFPAIRQMKVKVSKINPPMGGKMRSVSLEMADVGKK